MFSFPSQYIQYLNVVLILWFILTLYNGYKNGLLMQIVSLVGSVVALFAAWLFAPVFSSLFEFVKADGAGTLTIEQTVKSQANVLICFIILFILVKLLVQLLTPLVRLISKVPFVKQVNSVVGAAFSLVFFAIKLLLLTYFLTMPIVKNGQDIIDNTFIRPFLEVSSPVIQYFDQTLYTNTAIQSILDQKSLTPEQHDAAVKWLQEKGFNQLEIEEFFSQYE